MIHRESGGPEVTLGGEGKGLLLSLLSNVPFDPCGVGGWDDTHTPNNDFQAKKFKT